MDAHLAAAAGGIAAEIGRDAVDVLEHLLREGGQHAPGGRGRHAAGVPIEELGAQLDLEGLDTLADGRWRDVLALRCLADVAEIVDRQKQAQGRQIWPKHLISPLDQERIFCPLPSRPAWGRARPRQRLHCPLSLHKERVLPGLAGAIRLGRKARGSQFDNGGLLIGYFCCDPLPASVRSS